MREVIFDKKRSSTITRPLCRTEPAVLQRIAQRMEERHLDWNIPV
jgi:hypothetical protein